MSEEQSVAPEVEAPVAETPETGSEQAPAESTTANDAPETTTAPVSEDVQTQPDESKGSEEETRVPLSRLEQVLEQKRESDARLQNYEEVLDYIQKQGGYTSKEEAEWAIRDTLRQQQSPMSDSTTGAPAQPGMVDPSTVQERMRNEKLSQEVAVLKAERDVERLVKDVPEAKHAEEALRLQAIKNPDRDVKELYDELYAPVVRSVSNAQTDASKGSAHNAGSSRSNADAEPNYQDMSLEELEKIIPKGKGQYYA